MSNQNLSERLAKKKRVQRLKAGLIVFVLTWMLVGMLISVTLIVKVWSLQDQIDIITENTIRSQQAGRQENQAAMSDNIQEYGTGTDSDGKNGNSGKDTSDKHNTGRDDTEKDNSDKNEADGQNPDQTSEPDPEDDEDIMKVYLTFDDGPSANTEQILDILDEYKVKATFFVTGRDDEESLNMYKEIVDRGHSLGMHSYSHKYDVIYDSVKQFKADFEQIQGRIKEATGQTCRLFRFPGGSSNQVSKIDMKEFIRFLNKQGVTYFDWNVECGDATSIPYTKDDLVENVMKDMGKYHTSVVLMHDSVDKPNTVKALPVIIKKVQAMDAVILPISEKTKVVQHVSADSVKD